MVAGASDRILVDLDWLGITWDEGPRVGGLHAPYFQSQRKHLYDDAITALDTLGLVYPCTCSRADITRASSAPHQGDSPEAGARYPGTCRDPRARRTDRPAALRLKIPAQSPLAAREPDLVLRRADGVASYNLAVVVDDLAMGITEVVRGDDLLSSTPLQQLIAELLGASARIPSYLHLPVVLGPDGNRLAKRHQARYVNSTIGELRSAGVVREDIWGAIASALGLEAPPRPTSLALLVDMMGQHGDVFSKVSWTPRWVRPR
ncbi:MAG: hypothetical protein NVSMB1_24850 [Polyangiales bacterium]